jgi:hypothetical protein
MWLSSEKDGYHNRFVLTEAHMSKITFSQAMQGYFLAAGARHLSKHTIRDYLNTLLKRTITRFTEPSSI